MVYVNVSFITLISHNSHLPVEFSNEIILINKLSNVIDEQLIVRLHKQVSRRLIACFIVIYDTS
jgi:hypothetical protein